MWVYKYLSTCKLGAQFINNSQFKQSRPFNYDLNGLNDSSYPLIIINLDWTIILLFLFFPSLELVNYIRLMLFCNCSVHNTK